jgi:hypothetical protein
MRTARLVGFPLAWCGYHPHVQDWSDSPSDCFYTTSPQPGQPLNLPTYQHQFHLPAGQTVSWPISSYDWPLPALATGTMWDVTVDCGADHVTHQVKQF